MLKHRGLHQYTGDEASNLSMNMIGFDAARVAGTSATEFNISSLAPNNVYWCAIIILSDNVELQAKCHPDFGGDDLSTTGVYDDTANRRIHCAHGDIIYGCFTEVSLCEIDAAGGDALIQLIRGK